MKLIPLLLAITLMFTANGYAADDREQQAWQRIEQGALIIDTRTPQEYAQGHLEGAINIPFNVAVTQFKALEIRKDRSVVLYCRSGIRAGKALNFLTEAGYTQVHNGGGYEGMMASKQ